MQNLRISLAALGVAVCLSASAQYGPGGLSQSDLKTLSDSYTPTTSDKAITNALASGSINTLALNQERMNNFDTHFSHKVPTKGISNQKSSGRCWLFTGLNVLRSDMINKLNLSSFQLSQNYNFFYDQLEKSNLFLQAIIDTAKEPSDNRTVDWLFHNPLSDGGQFTGVADNIMKYGVVPASVMAETAQSNSTGTMRMLLSNKLREWGLQLRKMASDGANTKALEAKKMEMLKEAYRFLALNLGVPPTEFTWTRYDAKGEPVDTRTYTPQEFYKEYIGTDLRSDFVMMMNDPSRPYYEVYEIDLDRHLYDGDNWKFVNVPIEVIKETAIKSIKDSTMMYFSCDVGKFFDRERGALDLDTYDYGSLFDTTYGMNKAERIASGASASSHAMTLAGVDLDKDGKPVKWWVENSWGPGANDGHLIMTDAWMDEYLFRLVANRQYVPAKVLETLKNKKPIKLPAWDPLYSGDSFTMPE